MRVKWLHAAAPVAVLILVPFSRVPAQGADNGTPNCSVDGAPAGKPWPVGTTIQVTFNNTLDPVLEQFGTNPANGNIFSYGSAASRAAAFQQAVTAWNNALAAQGPPIIQFAAAVINNNTWSANQNLQLCVDDGGADGLRVRQGLLIAANTPVLNFTTNLPPAFIWASTGQPKPGINNPNAVPPQVAQVGPGWITSNVIVSDGAPSITTDLLGLTSPGGGGVAADIAWITHWKSAAPGKCTEIPWDYRLNAAGADPVAPDGGRADFYSVMLHELGHTLGLGHVVDTNAVGTITDNVMQPALKRGLRLKVYQSLEISCLNALYTQAAAPLPTWMYAVLAGLLGLCILSVRRRGRRLLGTPTT